jgi:Transposase zinc-binding domain
LPFPTCGLRGVDMAFVSALFDLHMIVVNMLPQHRRDYWTNPHREHCRTYISDWTARFQLIHDFYDRSDLLRQRLLAQERKCSGQFRVAPAFVALGLTLSCLPAPQASRSPPGRDQLQHGKDPVRTNGPAEMRWLDSSFCPTGVSVTGIFHGLSHELRSFLECGILAYGFVRVHSDACGNDKAVPFSCKRRGFCPSCCAAG